MDASFVIRAYNAEATIARAIESALRQDFRGEYEILLVDDGSRDATVVEAKRVGGERVRVISQENRGIAVAANVGIQEARGNVIVLLDADDEATPQSCSAAYEGLRSGAEYAYGDYYEEYRGAKKLVQPADPLKAPAGAFAWRRDALLEEGGFGTETMFPEYEVLLKTWRRWSGVRILQAVFVYHRSLESLTGDPTRVESALKILRDMYPERGEQIARIRSYSL